MLKNCNRLLYHIKHIIIARNKHSHWLFFVFKVRRFLPFDDGQKQSALKNFAAVSLFSFVRLPSGARLSVSLKLFQLTFYRVPSLSSQSRRHGGLWWA